MASTIIAVRSLIARTCCLFIATFGLMRVDVRAQSNPTEIKILEGVESVFEGNIGSEPATFIIQFFGDVDSATQKKITKITGHYYLKKDEISIPFTGNSDVSIDKINLQLPDGTANLSRATETIGEATATVYKGTFKIKSKVYPVSFQEILDDIPAYTRSKRLTDIPLLKLDHPTKSAYVGIVIAWPLDDAPESKALRAFTWDNLVGLESLGEEESNTSRYIAMPNADDVDVVVQQMKRVQKKLQNLSQQYMPDSGMPDYQYALNLVYKRDFSSVLYQNHSYQEYQFTGGAHGMYGESTLCINAQTGNLMDVENRIPASILPKIPGLLKKYYLSKQNEYLWTKEKPYKSLSELLFVEEFPGLGPNLYCTDLGLTTYWGLYEIAPYSSGIVKVTIPWKEIK